MEFLLGREPLLGIHERAQPEEVVEMVLMEVTGGQVEEEEVFVMISVGVLLLLREDPVAPPSFWVR